MKYKPKHEWNLCYLHKNISTNTKCIKILNDEII